MAQTNYSFSDFDNNSMAKAYGKSLPISTKVAINVCSALRGKTVAKALAYLQDVVDQKRAIAFTRFNDGVGHRSGAMAAGRYPKKASMAIAEVISSAASNAANQGLSSDLKIIAIIANKASTPLHQGRQRRRVMKRTHVEVVLKEIEGSTKTPPTSKVKKTSAKVETSAKPIPAKVETSKEVPKKAAVEKAQEVKKEAPEAKVANVKEEKKSVEPMAKAPVKEEVKND